MRYGFLEYYAVLGTTAMNYQSNPAKSAYEYSPHSSLQISIEQIMAMSKHDPKPV